MSSDGHCDDVGRDFAEIELTLGVKVTIRDTEAEADRAWQSGDGTQPDADGPRRERHDASGMGRRNSWPTGCDHMSSSGSGP